MEEQVSCCEGKEASTTSRTTTVNEHGRLVLSTPPIQSRFEFVFIENTNGISSTVSQKYARAYVAKQAHARVRRERIIKHQSSNCRHPEGAVGGYRYNELQSTDASSYMLNNGLLRPVSPRTLLSAAPTDPFASAARQMTLLEHSLIRHCRYSMPYFPRINIYIYHI